MGGKGKHYLWRKNSYVGVEKDDPGCVWTVFQLMNYHPWHNVKKMLPYMKEKPHKKSNKSVAEQIEYHNPQELDEETSTTFYSASVNSSPSRSGSGSRKRSIKARIKAMLGDKVSKSGKVNAIQEHELLALKEACSEVGAPTLISLLKKNPKWIRAANAEDEPSNHSLATSVKHNKNSKDDFVGVLELFKVDQNLFLKILQETPPKKHRLVKSGSFPFSKYPSQTPSSPIFGRSPSKLEHKHNEVWPMPNQGQELRKTKSQGIARSSSLKESLGKYGNLFDTTTTNTSTSKNKGIQKHLSKSLKLTNEMDFATLMSTDQHGQRSIRERMYLPEVESETPRASLDYFLNNVSQGDEMRVLRLDSPRQLNNGPDYTVSFAESNTDLRSSTSLGIEQGVIITQQVEVSELITDRSFETNDERLSSVFGLDVQQYQHDQIENVDWPILEDYSSSATHSSSTLFDIAEDVQGQDAYSILFDKNEIMDYGNESLQYVKYVVEIVGFTTADDQLEAWHSPDQPLDPALFDGIEVCCPFEPTKQSNKEAIMSSSRRKILFDLINEALLDIHENLYAYYPKALSSSCIVHPAPKAKNRVVEQVWEFVNEYISWRPELDVELNLAMEKDLSRHKSGWCNMQTDTELLAIDLEDWIFSDLLDEIVLC